jgi:hypothetical protein
MILMLIQKIEDNFQALESTFTVKFFGILSGSLITGTIAPLHSLRPSLSS